MALDSPVPDHSISCGRGRGLKRSPPVAIAKETCALSDDRFRMEEQKSIVATATVARDHLSLIARLHSLPDRSKLRATLAEFDTELVE
jgi:hypothetical protein